jgi:hypothetical protein
VKPDHTVPLGEGKLTPIMEWQRAQTLPEPPVGPAKAPQDPQLDKALEVLRKAIKK